jgi:hypothetical protein
MCAHGMFFRLLSLFSFFVRRSVVCSLFSDFCFGTRILFSFVSSVALIPLPPLSVFVFQLPFHSLAPAQVFAAGRLHDGRGQNRRRQTRRRAHETVRAYVFRIFLPLFSKCQNVFMQC